MQEHEGKMHPVRFCGRFLKEAEMNYHPAEKEVLALLRLLKTCYTQLAGRWVHTSKSLFGRTTQFAVMLSPWHLVVTRVKENDCSFAQLFFVDLEDSLATVTPPTKGSSTVRMDPQLLYARLPRTYSRLVVSFDGSAKTEKYGGYGSCSWIVWRLPDWTIVTAASAYLEATTVNMAEYSGMNNGVQAALDFDATDLVIVGDSRLGVIACKIESLTAQLNRHRELVARLKSVKYLHSVREYNASADSLATETLENKASSASRVNRIQEVIYAPTTESSADEPSVSIAQAQVQTRHLRHMEPSQRSGTVPEPRRKNFFDFVGRDLTVTTRLQAKSKPKRVRSADETSVTGEGDATQREEANGVPTEDSIRLETQLSRVTAPNGTTAALPDAEDVDPLTVQRDGEEGSRLLRTRSYGGRI
ncbi:hypothetical protein PHMEG_00017486 [Phytophthora megakarya]|uniref:RNase H type-1 domain-containing protein n=1 Tax=Phytophthora megakarya TaxID=4795 RepID=A0A225VYA7_9STRA|nr:hypothetical protein PHMEG_00017486 [Phytophthora megakarya]